MTPALTKHLRPAYAECGGVFMKKIVLSQPDS